MTVQHFLILIILNPTKIKEAKTNQGIFKQELATDKKKAGASKTNTVFLLVLSAFLFAFMFHFLLGLNDSMCPVPIGQISLHCSAFATKFAFSFFGFLNQLACIIFSKRTIPKT
jgi:hypothetical protein